MMLLTQMAGRFATPSLRTGEDVVGHPTIVPQMRIEHKKAIRPSHGVSHFLNSLTFWYLSPQLCLA